MMIGAEARAVMSLALEIISASAMGRKNAKKRQYPVVEACYLFTSLRAIWPCCVEVWSGESSKEDFKMSTALVIILLWGFHVEIWGQS